MSEETDEENTLRVNIIIDIDRWVNWVIVDENGNPGMSGNDPIDEFIELMREWGDELNE